MLFHKRVHDPVWPGLHLLIYIPDWIVLEVLGGSVDGFDYDKFVAGIIHYYS